MSYDCLTIWKVQNVFKLLIIIILVNILNRKRKHQQTKRTKKVRKRMLTKKLRLRKKRKKKLLRKVLQIYLHNKLWLSLVWHLLPWEKTSVAKCSLGTFTKILKEGVVDPKCSAIPLITKHPVS